MKKIDHQLDYSSVQQHRREECLHYASCLEEASAMLWPSFSCESCTQFCRGANTIVSYERALSPLAWEV